MRMKLTLRVIAILCLGMIGRSGLAQQQLNESAGADAAQIQSNPPSLNRDSIPSSETSAAAPLPLSTVPATPARPLPVSAGRFTPQPSTQSSLLDSLLGQSFARSRGRGRLVRTPEFFGDSFVGGDMLLSTGFGVVRNDTPLAASARRAKIADHNKALPVDRAFVNYHHFAAAQNTVRGGIVDENSVDRWTVGFEKTYDCGRTSIEFRLPFAERFKLIEPDQQLVGGNVGNLAMILKRLLYRTETRAVSAGLGIDAPTGSGVRGLLPDPGVAYRIDNDSIHLMPYLGFVAAPGMWFYHGSIQFDVPINGNAIETERFGNIQRGVLDETPYFYFDISSGVWLIRENSRCPSSRLTGLAAMVEYHLTSTLGDGDFVSLAGGLASFGVPQDLGISNFTVGIHAEFDYLTKLRIGGAFPLSEEPERFFDSEVMVSLIRHF